MTKISIPIPTSPIGYVKVGDQQLPVIAPREWYRYFGLLFDAVGGDTGGIEDIGYEQAVLASPRTNLSSVETALAEVRALAMARNSYQSEIDALKTRTKNLEGSLYGMRTSSGFNPRVTKVKGTATNDNADSGDVGEYIESVVTLASPVALTTDTATNLTSFSLPAGDWDVEVLASFTGAAGTTCTRVAASLSLTTNTLDATLARQVYLEVSGAVFASNDVSPSVGPVRLSVAAATTIYAVVRATFAVSTCSAYGLLRARRMR